MADNYFRINTKSKVEVVDRLKHQSEYDGSIMLEPRLQKYLKTKIYQSKNNITPCIKPEETYQISSLDKDIIKIFLKNRKSAPSRPKKKFFPSVEFRNMEDSRVPENKKYQMYKPVNYGMFAPDEDNDYYEGEINKNVEMPDMREMTGFDIDNSRFDPRTDPRMRYPWVSGEEEYDKKTSQYRIGHDNIDYNRFRILDAKNYINYGSYGSMDNPMYSEKSDMDIDNKIVMPKVRSSNKRGLSTYDYRACKFIGEERVLKDSDFETALIRGMPANTTKSYGYRNPQEHYYQFLEDDFQNPDNSVIPGFRTGMSTRRDNKSLAKQNYTREIM